MMGFVVVPSPDLGLTSTSAVTQCRLSPTVLSNISAGGGKKIIHKTHLKIPSILFKVKQATKSETRCSFYSFILPLAWAAFRMVSRYAI